MSHLLEFFIVYFLILALLSIPTSAIIYFIGWRRHRRYKALLKKMLDISHSLKYNVHLDASIHRRCHCTNCWHLDEGVEEWMMEEVKN